MLMGIRKIRQYRMWALGVIPEYQGKAIDTLLYKATYDALKDRLACMEINYVLENNHRMINALLKMGSHRSGVTGSTRWRSLSPDHSPRAGRRCCQSQCGRAYGRRWPSPGRQLFPAGCKTRELAER